MKASLKKMHIAKVRAVNGNQILQNRLQSTKQEHYMKPNSLDIYLSNDGDSFSVGG